jgi:TetR/AcrR family transcriptional regulator, repressor of fatR-cypB operon
VEVPALQGGHAGVHSAGNKRLPRLASRLAAVFRPRSGPEAARSAILPLTAELAIANIRAMAPRLPFYLHEDDPPAKREILRAALKLFSERGLAATSIRDIADESGYTNPALYKHFASKDDLALHLFETCHARVWTDCAAALSSATGFDEKLEAYVGCWLRLLDEYPEVLAFLSDSARVLWPKAKPAVRRRTMIGLARSLVLEAPRLREASGGADPDAAAACVQGTLAELGRMIQVGVVRGPAIGWQPATVSLLRRIAV